MIGEGITKEGDLVPAGGGRLGLDMCNGPFLKKILLYTVPIFFTGVLQLLFNAADLMVIGQFRGPNAVSAVGATGALINLIVGLFMGLSVGAGVCVAQGIGARDWDRVSRSVHTALPAAAICGVFLTVVGISLSPHMLQLMDTPAQVIGLSTVYLRIYFSGIIPILLYNFGASILRSAGDTRSPLVYLMIAGVVNVALNLVFVLGLGMSVEGVALATVLSQTLSCVLVLRKLMRREDGCRLILKKLRIHPQVLKRIVAIGLPAGIQGTLLSISNVTIQSSVNSFGEVALSGSAAAGNIEGFVYMSMNAFQQAAVTFTGQNVGAGKFKNVWKITALCLLCVTLAGATFGTLAFTFAEQLLPLYLKDSVEAIQWGVTRMQYVCLLYFLFGIMDVLSGVLRGMGASVVPMLVSILGICGLRVLWVATVFPRFRTFDSLFISYPVSWVVAGSGLSVCLLLIWRKKKRQMIKLQFSGTDTEP